MKYREISPSAPLKPYVKNFFYFETDTPVEIQDVVFPSGYMEFVFNLGEGIWKTAKDGIFSKTPPIELWGQLTKPLAVKTQGKNVMLGIRFLAHSASYFLKEDASELNDRIEDLGYLAGESVQILYGRLHEEKNLNKRVTLIENFLLRRIAISDRKFERIGIVGQVIDEMTASHFAEPVQKIANRHNISPRYMQKLFLQHAGVTPKLFGKIGRFQQSLQLVTTNGTSLTSIAYDCGYFDQSHFIREFKSFTGLTPSAFGEHTFPISAAIING
jgi:AraC-like DNA-binding protein